MVIRKEEFKKALERARRLHGENKTLTARQIAGEYGEECIELLVALLAKDFKQSYNEAIDVAVVAFRIAMGEFADSNAVNKPEADVLDVLWSVYEVVQRWKDSKSSLEAESLSLSVALFRTPIDPEYFQNAISCAAFALCIADIAQRYRDDPRIKSKEAS